MSQRKWYIRINVSEMPLATARKALDTAQATLKSQDRALLTRPNTDGFYYVEIHEWAQFDLFLGFLRRTETEFEDRTSNPPTLGPIKRVDPIDVRMDEVFGRVDEIFNKVDSFLDGFFGKPK